MVSGLPASALGPLLVILNAVARVILKNKASSCHLSEEFPHLLEWNPKTLIRPSWPLPLLLPDFISHHFLPGSLCWATLACLMVLKQIKHWTTSGPLHLLFLLFAKLFIPICDWCPSPLPLGLFSNVTYQWDHLWHHLICIDVYLCVFTFVCIYIQFKLCLVCCLSPPARL